MLRPDFKEFARLARAVGLEISTQTYIEAAAAIGVVAAAAALPAAPFTCIST